MSENREEPKGDRFLGGARPDSLALSFALLNLAAVIVLGSHLRIALTEKPYYLAQLNYSAQKLTALKATESQTEEAIAKREEQIKRSGALEGQYAALLTELLELSKVDPDARAITQKWKIQQQGAPRAEEVPAGSASSDIKAVQAPAKPRAVSVGASKN